jgi:hypothetical protein
MNTQKLEKAVDLRHALQRPSSFPGGFHRVAYPTDRFDLRAAAAEHVAMRGYTETPLPLDDLHLRVPKEAQLTEEGPLGAVSTNVNDTVPSLGHAYRGLIRYLAREVLGFDVVFEKNPFLRFHFPVRLPERYRSAKGAILAHHSDTLLGDYFEQINCWLPLSTCYGTNTLQCATLGTSVEVLSDFAAELGFDAEAYATSRQRFFEKLLADEALQERVLQSCSPLETRYSEVVMFDPRIIHSTAENTENGTRVSIDFRLLPLDVYEAYVRHFAESGQEPPEFDGMQLLKGGYYDERTAFEL